MTHNNVDQSLPLCELVRIAVENYFQQMDGESITNLHGMVIQEVEKPLLQMVLHHAGFNQSKASEMLGISRATLRKKMAEYEIA